MCPKCQYEQMRRDAQGISALVVCEHEARPLPELAIQRTEQYEPRKRGWPKGKPRKGAR